MTQIRQVQVGDLDCILRMWVDCGLNTGIGDSVKNLSALLHPKLFVVALEGGVVVGTLLGSFDGRRGWLNHLAVDPAHRHRGIATELVRDVEQRLGALGCRKVNLLIEPDNADVQQFYAALAYGDDELVFMEKWLEGDRQR